jgi:hypothetical protein
MVRRQQHIGAFQHNLTEGSFSFPAAFLGNNLGDPMTKPLDQIDEVIHDSKHPFRQVADRPEKPQKHRYERRKIREFIRACDWVSNK